MQLLIVDIQNTYRKYCHNIIMKVPDYAKNFPAIFYLFDNVDGQDISEEIPEEWIDDQPELVDRFNIISKNYAFFRGLMDAGVDEDDSEIVRLAQFMRKHRLVDAREICPDNLKVWKAYQKEFKNSPLQNIDFEDYSFYLPEDLISDLEAQIRDGVVLIGGGRNECLKEVALLLRVLEIKFTINEELTY